MLSLLLALSPLAEATPYDLFQDVRTSTTNTATNTWQFGRMQVTAASGESYYNPRPSTFSLLDKPVSPTTSMKLGPASSPMRGWCRNTLSGATECSPDDTSGSTRPIVAWNTTTTADILNPAWGVFPVFGLPTTGWLSQFTIQPPTGTALTATIPAGDFVFAQEPNYNAKDNGLETGSEYGAVIRFRAPANGAYSLLSTFKSLHNSGSSGYGIVSSNYGGRVDWDWDGNGIVDPVILGLGSVTGSYKVETNTRFSNEVPLYMRTGDTVDFIVANNTNSTGNSSDFIGVQVVALQDNDYDLIDNDDDNCPDLDNPDQLDNDGDGVGNFCDDNPSDDTVFTDSSLGFGDITVTTSSTNIVVNFPNSTTSQVNGFIFGIATTADMVYGYAMENGFNYNFSGTPFIHSVASGKSMTLTTIACDEPLDSSPFPTAGSQTCYKGDTTLAYDPITEPYAIYDALDVPVTTYYVEITGGSRAGECYIFGEFSTYYTDFGCTYIY